MSIFAVANQKGGVGKSTTAINLGAALARRGQRTLLVDCDPQSNATSGLGVRAEAGPTIYDLLAESATLAACAIPTHEPGLDLVPATPDLAGAEVELATAPAREYRLQRALRPAGDFYAFVLIDCPPSLGLLTVNALTAADAVLVPVQCEYLALEGLGHLATTIDLVRRNLNPRLTIAGLALTMFDARTKLSDQVTAEVRRHFPQTFATVIPRSIRLSEAPSFGQSIFAYAPDSRGAEAYARLADELCARYPIRSAVPVPVTTAYASAPTTDQRVAGGIL